MLVPLILGRDAAKRAIQRAVAEDRRILAVTQRRADDDDPTPSALYGVGTIVSVLPVLSRDGNLRAVAKCLKRAAIVRWTEGPFLTATIAPIEGTRDKDEEAVALSRTLIEKLRARGKFPFMYPRGYDCLWHGPSDEPGVLADAVVGRLWGDILCGTIEQKQEILEAADVVTRLQRILALIQADEQAA
jgi:uncharacterized protein